MNDIVTIGVRVYNAERYIERCARSLFSQTYDTLAYLFVNDGTPDNSIEVLQRVMEEYPQRKSQVKIINHDYNRGGAAAQNTLFEECDSGWFYMVDSDDWIEPDTIEFLVNKQKETNADIVSSHIILNENDVNSNYICPNYLSTHDMLIDMLSSVHHHELCSRLIRCDLFKNDGIVVPEGHNIGEDWYVMPKLVYYSQKTALVPNYLYHYFKGNEQSYMALANNDSSRLCEQNILTLFSLMDFFEGKNESIYVDAISGFLVKQIDWGLYIGLDDNNIDYYHKILAYKKNLGADYQKRIWKGKLGKGFINNYLLNHMLYNIKKTVASWI